MEPEPVCPEDPWNVLRYARGSRADLQVRDFILEKEFKAFGGVSRVTFHVRKDVTSDSGVIFTGR